MTARGAGGLAAAAADLPPAAFSIVMATGIVSVAAWLLGVRWLGLVLLGLNVLLYVGLLALLAWRLVAFAERVIADLRSHGRAPGFLTAVAGTCVLGTQVVVLTGECVIAAGLWMLGIVLWAALLYAVLFVLTVEADKPPIDEGLNGAWMLIVVATESVAVLGTLVAPALGPLAEPALALALGAFLLGSLFYVVLLVLILYRFLFFPIAAAQLTPPYWIAMGAVAITTLAGALLVLQADGTAFLRDLRPFVRGMTAMFWAMATWWIPLLLLLGAWRHLARRVPLRYDLQYWSMVFPLGMYTVATLRFAQAMDWPFLQPLPYVVGVAAVGAWAVTFLGLLRQLHRATTARDIDRVPRT